MPRFIPSFSGCRRAGGKCRQTAAIRLKLNPIWNFRYCCQETPFCWRFHDNLAKMTVQSVVNAQTVQRYLIASRSNQIREQIYVHPDSKHEPLLTTRIRAHPVCAKRLQCSSSRITSKILSSPFSILSVTSGARRLCWVGTAGISTARPYKSS